MLFLSVVTNPFLQPQRTAPRFQPKGSYHRAHQATSARSSAHRVADAQASSSPSLRPPIVPPPGLAPSHMPAEVVGPFIYTAPNGIPMARYFITQPLSYPPPPVGQPPVLPPPFPLAPVAPVLSLPTSLPPPPALPIPTPQRPPLPLPLGLPSTQPRYPLSPQDLTMATARSSTPTPPFSLQQPPALPDIYTAPPPVPPRANKSPRARRDNRPPVPPRADRPRHKSPPPPFIPRPPSRKPWQQPPVTPTTTPTPDVTVRSPPLQLPVSRPDVLPIPHPPFRYGYTETVFPVAKPIVTKDDQPTYITDPLLSDNPSMPSLIDGPPSTSSGRHAPVHFYGSDQYSDPDLDRLEIVVDDSPSPSLSPPKVSPPPTTPSDAATACCNRHAQAPSGLLALALAASPANYPNPPNVSLPVQALSGASSDTSRSLTTPLLATPDSFGLPVERPLSSTPESGAAAQQKLRQALLDARAKSVCAARPEHDRPPILTPTFVLNHSRYINPTARLPFDVPINYDIFYYRVYRAAILTVGLLYHYPPDIPTPIDTYSSADEEPLTEREVRYKVNAYFDGELSSSECAP